MQLALATNEEKESYAIFVYHKIEWVKGGEKFATAGFFSSDGRSEKLANSGSEAIVDLLR